MLVVLKFINRFFRIVEPKKKGVGKLNKGPSCYTDKNK